MSDIKRNLTILPDELAICRLPSDAPFPDWAMDRGDSFCSMTLTRDELSIICKQSRVPPDFDGPIFSGWRCLKLEGPFGMQEVGVLAPLATLLAGAGLSVFAEATYDTDYLLVTDLPAAVEALRARGHAVTEQT